MSRYVDIAPDESDSLERRRSASVILEAAVAVVVLLAACGKSDSGSVKLGDPLDDLVGCYSRTKGGDAEIRIRKQEGQYLLSLASDWSDEVIGAEPTSEEVTGLFQEEANQYVAGLYSGMMGVFKVRPGMQVNNEIVSEGYVVVIPFGAGEVFQATCPS